MATTQRQSIEPTTTTTRNKQTTVDAHTGWDVKPLIGKYQKLQLTSWRQGSLLTHYAKFSDFINIDNSYDPSKLLELSKSTSTSSTTALVKSASKGVSVTQTEVGGNSQTEQKKGVAQLFADYYVFEHGKGIYSLHRHTGTSRHVRRYAPGRYYIRQVHMKSNYLKLDSHDSSLETVVAFRRFEYPGEIWKFLKAGCTHRTEAERKNTPKSVLIQEERRNKDSMCQQAESMNEFFHVQGIRTSEPNSSVTYQLVQIKKYR